MKRMFKIVSVLFISLFLIRFTFSVAEESIRLSASTKPLEKIPAMVLPNAEGEIIILSNFELSMDDEKIAGTINFENGSVDEPFTLVLFISCGEDDVICYFDKGNQFYISNQSGEWSQLFEPGYEISGKPGKGVLQFGFDKHNQVLGNFGAKKTIYNLDGLKGDIYSFCVSGEIQFMSSMPGNQKDSNAFHANSNVLKISESF